MKKLILVAALYCAQAFAVTGYLGSCTMGTGPSGAMVYIGTYMAGVVTATFYFPADKVRWCPQSIDIP